MQNANILTGIKQQYVLRLWVGFARNRHKNHLNYNVN